MINSTCDENTKVKEVNIAFHGDLIIHAYSLGSQKHSMRPMKNVTLTTDESATRIEMRSSLSAITHTYYYCTLLLFITFLDTVVVGGGRQLSLSSLFRLEILRPKRKLRHVHFLYPSWVSHRFPRLIRLPKSFRKYKQCGYKMYFEYLGSRYQYWR